MLRVRMPTALLLEASASVSATVSATDDNDSATITGTIAISATVAATDADDTATITGSVSIAAAISATDADDSATITGQAIVGGTVTATDADDSATITGTVDIAGTVSATDADDQATIAGTVAIAGAVTATDADDSAAIYGIVLPVIAATVSATDSDDAATITAALVAAIDATITATDADDVAAITGTVSVAGSVTATDDDDSAVIYGIVLPVIEGSVTATDADDSATITGVAIPLPSSTNPPDLDGLLTAIVNKLRADPAVAAILGDRIYSHAPESTALPMAVVSINQADEWDAKDASGWAAGAEITVNTDERGSLVGLDAASAIDAALHHSAGWLLSGESGSVVASSVLSIATTRASDGLGFSHVVAASFLVDQSPRVQPIPASPARPHPSLSALLTGVVERLRSWPGLVALVGDRIYNHTPAGTPLPGVTVSLAQANGWDDKGASGWDASVSVVVHSDHRGPRDAMRINNEVIAALHRYGSFVLPWGGGSVVVFQRLQAESSQVQDGLGFQAVSTYQALVNQD